MKSHCRAIYRNLQFFALMGRHDMVGDPVGTHHLADEFQRSV